MRNPLLHFKQSRPPLPRRPPAPSPPTSDETTRPPPRPPPWDLLFRRVSTVDHLRQLLSHAIVAGLLAPGPSSSPSGSGVRNTGLPILNSALQTLAGGRSPEHAASLYGAIRRGGVAPDDYTFTFVLKAAARLGISRGGEQLHSLSLKLGFGFNVFVQNSLIHMYFACGMPVSARQAFDTMSHVIRDVVSWNSMISGRIGAVEAGRQIHGLIMVNGFDLDFFLGSSLIDAYAKCGFVHESRRVFDIMPDKNTISKVKPDEATMASVISACGQLGALDQGRWIHAYCDISGLGLNLKIKNALIDMYAKCGDMKRALQIFHDLEHRDVFSWTAMISGLAMNGFSDKALDLFSQMESLSMVVPNEITFLGVLSACSHAGIVERGFYYFHSMTEAYNLTPRIQHYGCIVDLLGRARLVTEALSFIRKMPIQPDLIIWRSLLFACRNSKNVELAELAVRCITELEPRKPGVHVLLSNVYALASKWRDVNVIDLTLKFI
ncbi:hypothetical protein Taro_051227 [Colocasia esculenta]|uniref:Pentatricopeptide repeat-containing protein n=1 Tax=Colocasia esculenta TaxID=4460 RepID=A0A843XFE7_COLES|nr:hypothetical protein [Colocasia esculenta]